MTEIDDKIIVIDLDDPDSSVKLQDVPEDIPIIVNSYEILRETKTLFEIKSMASDIEIYKGVKDKNPRDRRRGKNRERQRIGNIF